MQHIKTAQEAAAWIKTHNRNKFRSRYNACKVSGIKDPRLKNLELGGGTITSFFADCDKLGVEVILRSKQQG
jgi:hypothetical protein